VGGADHPIGLGEAIGALDRDRSGAHGGDRTALGVDRLGAAARLRGDGLAVHRAQRGAEGEAPASARPAPAGERPPGRGARAPDGDAAAAPDADGPDVAAMATPAPASRAAMATPARITGLPGSLRVPSMRVRLPSGRRGPGAGESISMLTSRVGP